MTPEMNELLEELKFELLEKGGGARLDDKDGFPIGTERQWKSGTAIKTANGWVYKKTQKTFSKNKNKPPPQPVKVTPVEPEPEPEKKKEPEKTPEKEPEKKDPEKSPEAPKKSPPEKPASPEKKADRTIKQLAADLKATMQAQVKAKLQKASDAGVKTDKVTAGKDRLKLGIAQLKNAYGAIFKGKKLKKLDAKGDEDEGDDTTPPKRPRRRRKRVLPVTTPTEQG